MKKYYYLNISKTTCFIYGLIDSATQEIRYVGKTTTGNHRIRNHCHISQILKGVYSPKHIQIEYYNE